VIKIKSIILDEYIENHKIEKIDFMKIDAEWAEYKIFHWLQKSIKENKITTFYFETNSQSQKEEIKWILDFLEKNWYENYWLNEKNWKLKNWNWELNCFSVLKKEKEILKDYF
jgi:hypothetical protein